MTELAFLEWCLPPSARLGFPVMAGAIPGLGHTLAIHLDAMGALRRARASLGPVFWMHMGVGNWILICAGKGSFDLLKHPSVANVGSRETLRFILGRSLLAVDGAEHRRVRSAMNHAFSPRSFLESGSGARVAEVVSARASRWAALDRVPVHEEMKEMTLDVLFRVAGVGSHDLPAWREQYSELLLGILPIPWDLPLSPRRRALRAADWLNAEIEAIVRRATREGAGDSVTHALVSARNEAGEALSISDLVDNIRLLFLAGHETTATTTAWAILELARQPELWDRMVDEVSAAGGVPMSHADAKAFPLCEAIFRESVRLYGPAWFVERRSVKPLEHEGRTIPAGINVGLPTTLWARDEEAFPEPDRFRPDRWLERSSPTPFEVSQFGGGAHFCLGYHFAWLEVVAFLAALGREMGRAGKRPHLDASGPLVQRYLPMPHPPAHAGVRFRPS